MITLIEQQQTKSAAGNYFILARIQIPGFHRWPGAPDRLAYLRSRHRHVFDIIAKFHVCHANRDKEIIETQVAMQDYLFINYGVGDGYHIDIGTMSCEMLAKDIANHFGASEVIVLEDSQGGVGYTAQGA